MSSERSQLYYTCVFLQVSFQAITHSVLANTEQTSRCWLDARTLEMLLDELKRCRQNASPFREVHSSLDQATYHCGLLMAQCPGALDRHLCRHHLEAISAPLGQAVRSLATASAQSNRTSSSARGFRHWFGH
ncbi:hypothetical protein BTW07_12695 [Salinicola socius]|uniref:Uncharacterized protein n=2 Tax=Halomonadaceae TaxID=28256 RepID=A0A1Q8SQX4_9GAMM|nr:hypothetical protein BTW07_12695 [Salinicola socius]